MYFVAKLYKCIIITCEFPSQNQDCFLLLLVEIILILGQPVLVRFLVQEARSKKQETLKKPEYLITIALAQLLWLGSDEVDLWLAGSISGLGEPQLWLPSKFRSQKIPWNRLGTVFVIPRTQLLLSRYFACLGISHSEVRKRTNRTKFARKCFVKVIHMFLFVLEWFGTSFQRFFSFA